MADRVFLITGASTRIGPATGAQGYRLVLAAPSEHRLAAAVVDAFGGIDLAWGLNVDFVCVGRGSAARSGQR